MTLTREEKEVLRKASRVGSTVRFGLPVDQKRRIVVGEVVDEVGFIRNRHEVVQKIPYPQRHLWDDDVVA